MTSKSANSHGVRLHHVEANTSINRDGIRYPRPETEQERYLRHQEQARLTGMLASSTQPSAANAAAAAQLQARQPSMIPYAAQAAAAAAAAAAAPVCVDSQPTTGGPSEVDRRTRDAIAIIQLRILKEKLRRERELLKSSSEGESDSSTSEDDIVAQSRIKQALAHREELLRQVEEFKLNQVKQQSPRIELTPAPPPPPPQPVVVKVDQPRDHSVETLTEIQKLSAAIKEAALATVAPPRLPSPRPEPQVIQVHVPQPPPPQPPPPPPSVVETSRKAKNQTTTVNTAGMGDKYQDLMEMMMMQSYQMQQMVMQQALLGAVTNQPAGSTPGLASCGVANRPAVVQIAGKKGRRGHSCHGHCAGGGGPPPPPMLPQMASSQMGATAGGLSMMGGGQQQQQQVDSKLQKQLEQQQQMLQQMQQQLQQQHKQPRNAVRRNDRAMEAAMLAMQPQQRAGTPLYDHNAMEGDPLNLPKDRRREVKEAKLGDIDWNAPDSWWKRDRVAIKMRHFFYVAWFIGSMKASAAEKGKTYNTDRVAFDDIIAFEIIIREIITAIHRIYLDPDSEMYQLLQTLVSPNAIDLRLSLRDSAEATQEFIYLLENIVFQMTYIQTFLPMRYHLRSLVTETSHDLSRAIAPFYPRTEIAFDQQGNQIEPPTEEQVEEATAKVEEIMLNLVYHMAGEIPDTGVLGTHRRSHVFALIKDGQLFPPEEFWEIEKKLLRFDSNGRTVNIGTREAMLLLVMFFLARGLCWTLLMNPVDYGLNPVEPDPVSKENLKLMASVLIYLYRRVMVPRDARVIPPAPQEIAYMLVRDEVMEPLLQRIETSITYCDGLIREWANAYVRRLKQALPPKAAEF